MAIVRRTLKQAMKHKMTPAETARLDGLTDAQINRAARSDPDNQPSTRRELAQIAAAVKRRGRPAMKASERKIQVALRLPPDVVKYFRSFGPGWQSQMGAVLADHVKRRKAK